MGNRNPVRFLAPLALVAAIVAVIVVVQSAGGDPSNGGKPTATVKTHQHGARRHARRRFYVVKSGDNLSLIAERTGVELGTIQELNPDLDAQALRVGQRLRLVP
jgi:LysM domain